MPALPSLPIDARLAEVRDLVGAHGGLVLVAEPGAGKTTRVPPALLGLGAQTAASPESGEVWVVEPRRLAARMAAVRVAEEQGDDVGGLVGYTVRFEDRTGPKTRIRFVTEGILLRRLETDAELRGVRALVFDEFHERNLDSDLALAWARALRRGARPDLKILVMSATMDPARVASFLDVPVLHVEGRTFPVTVEYTDTGLDRPLHEQVAAAVRRVLVRFQGEARTEAGDVLVFLPGAGEIRRAMEACEPLVQAFGVELAALHGDLPPAEQDRALRRGAKPKVIFSTNIAETSLTIPSVTAVVDSGLARAVRHSPWSGLARLETVKISQASAVQRAGRAGRVGPGLAVRVYPKHVFDAAPKRDVPEVERTDFAPAELLLRASAPPGFELFEAPPEAARARAAADLTRFGAVDGEGRVTAVGRRLLTLPVHPRLGTLVLSGERRGVAARGCLAAAVLEERELRLGARTQFRGPRTAAESGPSDVLARIEAYENVALEGASGAAFRVHEVDRQAFDAVRKAFQQLCRAARVNPDAAGSLHDEEGPLGEALLDAYADRVARRRAPGSAEVVFADGGSGRLADTSVVREAEFLLAIDVDEGGRGGTTVRVASAIEPEWLLGLEGVGEAHELTFDPKTERVVARTQLSYGKLVLDRSDRPAEPSAEVTAVLLAALREKGLAAVWKMESAEELLARWRYAASVEPDFPRADDGALDALLVPALEGCTSFSDLRAFTPDALLAQALGAERMRALDAIAPSHVKLPGRGPCPVHYEPHKPPWMESRLQDFFGMAEGPCTNRGREPIVLHLLAPNYRAVQVTTDLAGFWAKHYPGLRTPLMRRYPRHDWPEDPLHATPPQRRR